MTQEKQALCLGHVKHQKPGKHCGKCDRDAESPALGAAVLEGCPGCELAAVLEECPGCELAAVLEGCPGCELAPVLEGCPRCELAAVLEGCPGCELAQQTAKESLQVLHLGAAWLVDHSGLARAGTAG